MLYTINENTLQISTGDITKQFEDAIVNAANGSLLGGGGVDGAIHKAAGPELLEACKNIRKNELNGEYLQTGEVVMTKGYNLPAKYVIHTVGPIWDESLKEEQEKQLANCYRNALNFAKKKELKSIVFPSISTGAYGYPIELASSIALETVISFLENNTFGKVIFILFSEKDFEIYKRRIKSIVSN